MRPDQVLGMLRGRAAQVAGAVRERLAPPVAASASTLTLETMRLPNGQFVLVISDAPYEEGVTPEMADQLREQVGAAAVLVFDRPVVVYQAD